MKPSDPSIPLRKANQERFAQHVAEGMRLVEAHRAAGYRGKSKHTRGYASKLKRRVWPRIEYLLQRRASNQQRGSELAVHRIAIRKETVARELLKSGTGSMDDFVKFTSAGDPYFDIASATPEQRAAIQEMTIEEFKEGRGEDAREVRRVKIKLYNRNAALMNIARMFGWVIERQEDEKSLEARLRNMTEEQRREHNRDLMARIQTALAEAAAYKAAQAAASDAKYQDVPALEAPARR